MFDFKEELKKYKPVLDVDDLQDELDLNEMQDMLELLQHVTKKSGKE